MQFPLKWIEMYCKVEIHYECWIRLIFLARYQQEFDKGVSKAAAERFYHQAIALYPDNGNYSV